jgi:hypothetical protein
MAATTGLVEPSSARITLGSVGSWPALGVPNSRTSAPPEKARALPVSTMACTCGSASAWSSAATMPLRKAWPRPLTGGLFSVTTATGPCTA